MVACGGAQSTTVQDTTTTTIPIEEQLLIKNLSDSKLGVVRIVVKRNNVEASDNGELIKTQGSGSGSGFFISTDGYIITNNHVIAGAVTISVYIGEETKSYKAQVIGSSECDDIAILKIGLPVGGAFYFDLSESSPTLGEEILAVGFPDGDEQITYLNGIVSKETSDGSNQWSSIDYAFEHTAEILPGSSGGPIVNENGEVIGIAYAGNELRQEFGIPSVVVSNTITQILNNDFKKTLGINAEQFKDIGLYIYSVEPNSPFDNAGFDGGELITKINGYDMTEDETMQFYCNAIQTRGANAAIRFEGIDIEEGSEFEARVSLDGSTLYFEFIGDVTTTTKSTQKTKATTTTVNSSKPYFSSTVLNMWYESFKNKESRDFIRWDKDVTYSINGSHQNTDYNDVVQVMNLMNSTISSINISLIEGDADIDFYFIPENQFSNYDCNPSRLFTSRSGSYIGNAYIEYDACIKIGQEYIDDFTEGSKNDEQTIAECRIFHLRRTVISMFTGTYGDADPDLYGDNNYFSSPFCNYFQKVSDLDLQAIRLHYHPYIKDAETLEEAYNLLK